MATDVLTRRKIPANDASGAADREASRLFFSIGSKISLFVFLATLATAMLTGFLFYIQAGRIITQKHVNQLENSIRILMPHFTALYQEIRQDALLLSGVPPVQGIIRAQAHSGTDPLDGSLEEQWKDRLARIFEAMLEARPHYRQVRYIGIRDNGREIIRVNRTNGKIVRVADRDLQAKAEEPYFQKGIKTPPGRVYFSDITLNREHGRIAVPHMPMLRAAIPVHTPEGAVFGLIVVNVGFDALLQTIQAGAGENRNIYVADSNGYYLAHPDRAKIFGFEFGKEGTIYADFPAFKTVRDDERDRFNFFDRASQNYIHFRKIYPDPLDASRFQGIALTTPRSEVLRELVLIRNRSFVLTLALALTAAAVAVWVLRFVIEPLKQVIGEMRAYDRGKKSLSLPAGRRDEVGELAAAFSALTATLEESRQAEQQTLAELDAILNSTVDGLITIDETGIIRKFNPACEKIFGYEAAETIGKNVRMLMPEPYRHEHDGYLHNYHRTGEAKIIGIGREVRGRRKDGTVFPLDLSVSEVRAGSKHLYSGIVRDITDRKRTEEELLRSNMELERFAYICSHDLQEPLRMVRSYTQKLDRYFGEKGLEEKPAKYMHYVTDGARRAQNLISDILSYARLESENRREAVDTGKILETAMQNLEATVQEKKAVIAFDPLPVVSGNRVLLLQLFQNLLSNALKYCNTKPEIHVGVSETEEAWEFSVRDNGIGIDPAYHERIFIVFQRLHKKSDYGGTGIGLALCKKIVQKHGGEIRVRSRQGAGSTFLFTLPRHPGDNPDDENDKNDEKEAS